jgi:indole-3-glycerol phosphate synthase
MTDILDTILVQRAKDVAAARAAVSHADLAARAQARYPTAPLDLYTLASQQAGQLIAAEFKRSSPSKGEIARPDISAQVGAYIAGGATLISVLTEPAWFSGSLADMERARSLADEHAAMHGGQRPAILRKDFIFDEYQLAEARAWGADTALLIVNALAPGQLAPLIAASRVLGMEPLVEVCSVHELEDALVAGAAVIGVNNRNLRTFTLDMGTTSAVVAASLKRHSHVPPAADVGSSARPPVVLSLSGIKEADDLRSMVRDCAARAASDAGEARGPRLAACLRGFLIGEALMRSPDPAAMVRTVLVGAGRVQVVQTHGINRGGGGGGGGGGGPARGW